MAKIHILDPLVANQIAAGEVVERPASVVKELCENSLDAGASKIKIEIIRGGISKIKVTDNGSGMEKDDMILAFEAHATSKLSQIEDLLSIRTKGFRGEALASIASVSDIIVKSKAKQSDKAYEMFLRSSFLEDIKECSFPSGTSIEVRDLFYNTPARYKFLKSDQKEADKIKELVLRLALAHPDVSFSFVSQNKEIFKSPGNNNLADTIYALLGSKIYHELIPLEINESQNEDEKIKIRGFISQAEYAKRSRASQFFFVNKRPIKSKVLTAALDEAYKHRLMKGLYPSCILLIECSGNYVDVNVHPQKLEVKFTDESDIFRKVYHKIDNTLRMNHMPPKERPLTRQEHEKAEFTPMKQILEDDYISAKKSREIITSKQTDFLKDGMKELWQSIPVNIEYQDEIVKKDEENEIFKTKLPENIVQENISSKTLVQEEIVNYKGEKPVELSRRLSSLNYVGTAFASFLILEDKETLYLIDQHAAHEKINFEKFYAEYEKNKQFLIKDLLIPQKIELDNFEVNIVKNYTDEILRLGFSFDWFAGNTIVVRSVPEIYGDISSENIFRQIIDFFNEQSKKSAKYVFDEYVHDYLAEIACKASIKANDFLTKDEVKSLLIQMEDLKDPYHCPHGRPAIIQITREELEKRFRRIVN